MSSRFVWLISNFFLFLEQFPKYRDLMIREKLPLMSAIASATRLGRLPLLSAILVKSEPLSSEARLLTFEMADRPHLKFLAGQSIRIGFQTNEKTVSLAYSIASPPGTGSRFELCVKAVGNGSLPNRLLELNKGSPIWFYPPEGNFVVRQPSEDRLFLAAGTGIAPIRSMIHWLLRNNDGHRLQLLFGARDAKSLLFHSEFLALAQQHPQFTYLPIVSRPQKSWSGARGYVQDHIASLVFSPMEAYVCGPPAMIRHATACLNQLGWPNRLIHHDGESFQ